MQLQDGRSAVALRLGDRGRRHRPGDGAGGSRPLGRRELSSPVPSPGPGGRARRSSYRTPAEVMEVASLVLAQAAPSLKPPTAVRHTGVAPEFVETSPDSMAAEVASKAASHVGRAPSGTVAVLCPASLVAEIALALDAAGVQARDARRHGLGVPVSLLPVDLANGLEFDGVVVVEPQPSWRSPRRA